MQEILDINGNIKKWNSIKTVEYESGLIEGLTKHNSELAITNLKRFELGLDCSTKGARTPASLMRLRRAYRILQKRLGTKDNDIEKQTSERLSKIIIDENSEDFARNVKIIYNWLERTKKIKENPIKHISAKMFSKGKPAWCYLGEEKMKLLINSLNPNHKAITLFLYDSMIRPQEAWRILVSDFQDDYKILDIPEKRLNGQTVAKKNTFGRKIKLKMCSELIKEYVKINNLKSSDTLINITQAGYNKALRISAKKLFGTEPTKARERPNKITAYDIRHNGACFWLKRYKTNKDLMYRAGWKQEKEVFYYTEFLDMRDTIDDEDLITKEDKLQYEKEIDAQNKIIEELKKDINKFNKFEDILMQVILKGDVENMEKLRLLARQRMTEIEQEKIQEN